MAVYFAIKVPSEHDLRLLDPKFCAEFESEVSSGFRPRNGDFEKISFRIAIPALETPESLRLLNSIESPAFYIGQPTAAFYRALRLISFYRKQPPIELKAHPSPL